MAIKVIQNSFAAGALSESALGRSDLSLWGKAAREIENCYVNNLGNVERREGMRFLFSTPSNAEARLIEFSFNNVQNYLLEFKAGQFRVIKNDAVVATVTSAPINSLTLAQIKAMDYTQSADTLLLTHPDIAPITITRTSDTTWIVAQPTLSNIPWFAFGSLTVTTPAASVTPSRVSGKVKLTFSAGVASAAYVGQKIYFNKGGALRITEYIDASNVWAVFLVDAPDTTAVPTTEWELESGYEAVWSSSRGWPVTCLFAKNRLWFGGSKSRPQTVWFSVVGSFYDFDQGTGLDDEAGEATIDDGKLNPIKQLFLGTALQIYTSGAEFFVGLDNVVTPKEFLIKKATSHGITANPVSLDGTTIFVEGGGSVVRQFVYNDLEQTFNAPNVSILAQDYVNSVVRVAARGATSYSANSIAYVLNTDGTLAVFNTLREQEFRAWSIFKTDGIIEDVTVLGEAVYLIVRRVIGGNTVRNIEKLENGYMTDCAIKLSNPTAKDDWSGLDHLDGEVCSAIGDGYILTDVTPISGDITTNIDVEDLEVGLFFAAKIKLLPVEYALADSGFGSQGTYKRVVYANVRMLDSRGIKVVSFSRDYEPAYRRFGSNVFDIPVPLFTGWKKIFISGVAHETDIIITQDQPLDFNVLAVAVGVS